MTEDGGRRTEGGGQSGEGKDSSQERTVVRGLWSVVRKGQW